jgi:hypothetical protein
MYRNRNERRPGITREVYLPVQIWRSAQVSPSRSWSGGTGSCALWKSATVRCPIFYIGRRRHSQLCGFEVVSLNKPVKQNCRPIVKRGFTRDNEGWTEPAVWSRVMQPTTPLDFLKVALQRLTAAEEIMETLRLTLEAQYIGGYSVECSLKALILEKTAEPDRPAILDRLTHGATNHRAEVLLDRLREREVFLTIELAKRMRRFDWTTALRYETGRKDTGETNGLLRTARTIYEWVKGQIS